MAAPRPARLAVVDPLQCTACGICVDACLDGALTLDAIAVVNPGLCSGCGLCVAQCPTEALSLGRRPLERGAAA